MNLSLLFSYRKLTWPKHPSRLPTWLACWKYWESRYYFHSENKSTSFRRRRSSLGVPYPTRENSSTGHFPDRTRQFCCCSKRKKECSFLRLWSNNGCFGKRQYCKIWPCRFAHFRSTVFFQNKRTRHHSRRSPKRFPDPTERRSCPRTSSRKGSAKMRPAWGCWNPRSGPWCAPVWTWEWGPSSLFGALSGFDQVIVTCCSSFRRIKNLLWFWKWTY